jgi:hypothetical protein
MNDKLNTVNEIKQKAVEIKDLYEQYLKFSAMKFADIELQDGTKLVIDDGADLAVGTPIYKLDEKGTRQLPDDGDYVLADGRTITIASKDGVCVVTAVAEAAPDANAENNPANVSDVNQSSQDINMRVATLEQNIEKMMEMLQGIMQTHNSDMNTVAAKMAKLFESTEEEINRSTSVSTSVKDKVNSNIIADLKDYMNLKNFSSTKINRPEVKSGNKSVVNEYFQKFRSGEIDAVPGGITISK